MVKDTNGDNGMLDISHIDLSSKIYTIREQKVMLDSDLAEIYGYTTKAFNRQVKNNREKFEGEDFMFRLTQEELDLVLRCKKCTANISTMSRSLPHAFTEQGIYMLMTVLRGPLAIKQSRTLIMLFKAMKDYVVENHSLLKDRDNLRLRGKILDNAERIFEIENKIEKIDTKITEISTEISDVVKRSEIAPAFLEFNKGMENKEFLLLDGEPIYAKEAYMEIYKHAKKSICIIDDYISIKSLHLLQIVKQNLEITIFTDNVRNYLRRSDLDDFKKERPDLKIKLTKTGGKIHDRFIILDERKVYQAGGSSKDAGHKMTSIHEIMDVFIIKSVLDTVEKMKSNGMVVLW